MSHVFSIRSLALVATLVGGGLLGTGTAEAGGCQPSYPAAPKVVYVPVQPVYVQPAPVVRKVIVVQTAPVYRPSCH